MNKFYVYCVFSSESEEVLYVGKGCGDRMAVSLARLQRKFPGLELAARKLFSNLTSEAALKRETQLIAEIQPRENKIVSWVREKRGEKFGNARIHFSDPALADFLLAARKRIRVVVGGFEILLRTVVLGEIFHLSCRQMKEGAARTKFYVSLSEDGVIYCTGSATGLVEPSARAWDPECTLFSVVQNLAQSCFNLLSGLAERESRELGVDEVYWKKVDVLWETNPIPVGDKEEILRFFTSICAKQEFSRKDNAMVGVAHMLGFGFDAYTAGELAAKKGLKDAEGNRICGIVFKKYVGARVAWA